MIIVVCVISCCLELVYKPCLTSYVTIMPATMNLDILDDV